MTGQQPYEVVDRRDGFELRRYPVHLVAEIEVSGSFDEVLLGSPGIHCRWQQSVATGRA